MLQRLLALTCVGVLVSLSISSAQDKQDKKPDNSEALAKSLIDADTIFTGKIGKVMPLGQTNSIPPSTFGNITFKEGKALRGTAPEGKLNYSFREGNKHFDLEAKGDVLVAAKKNGVMAIVPATDANVALAKKVIGEPKQPEKK